MNDRAKNIALPLTTSSNTARVRNVLLAAGLLGGAALVDVAQAADDGSLTWNGVTLYGVYDIGVAYQTHGTPLSQDWFVGLQYLIQKSNNKSITSIAPNGLSQSRIGLRGTEEVADGLNFIFNVEMGFNPQSGKISDALAALTHNNGVALANQTSAGDSARAGQLFNSQAYAGLNSPAYGTFMIGRVNTLLLDNILKYDPMGGSYAFSVIGLSGTVGGGADTENTRLDSALKYVYKYDFLHAGLLYQPGKTDSSPGEGMQGNIGIDYQGLSIDGVYAHKKDAIASSSLSATQILTLPIDSLAATISDNTSYTLDASYTWGGFKAFLAYEHIKYQNPSDPINGPFTGLGGYYMSVVNNAAFPKPKVLEASWGGLKYAFSSNFDVTGAIYHYDQNSYGKVACSNTSAATCSGTLSAYSLMADYRWTKRLDTYAGAMLSRVTGGQASGFLNRQTVDPMVGFRFKF